METYTEYLAEISGDSSKAQAVAAVISDLFDKMKSNKDVRDALQRIHCIAYGWHFSKSLAMHAVEKLENVDGTDGAHWSYEEIARLAEIKRVENVPDLYYAMNMLYSDTSDLFGNDVDKYFSLAKALYFDDPDAPDGKLIRQWMAIAE